MIMKTKICTKCSIEKPLSEFYNSNKGKDNKQAHCKECDSLMSKTYYKNNKTKVKNKTKEYKETHKEYYNTYLKVYGQINKTTRNKLLKQKYQNNIQHKLVVTLRNRINAVLKRNKKVDKTINLLGCTIEEFKQYLESKFQPSMNWKNHNKNGWHIDHILPCASFDLSKPSEQRKCFHYTNLQPLWAEENLTKARTNWKQK